MRSPPLIMSENNSQEYILILQYLEMSKSHKESTRICGDVQEYLGIFKKNLDGSISVGGEQD